MELIWAAAAAAAVTNAIYCYVLAATANSHTEKVTASRHKAEAGTGSRQRRSVREARTDYTCVTQIALLSTRWTACMSEK